MNPIETIDYRNHKIKIYVDEAASNPLYDFGHPEGTLFFTSTRNDINHYWIKGKEPACGADRFLYRFVTGAAPTDPKFEETHYWLPIYRFEHGGVVYRNEPFNDPWDSGLAGMVSIPKSTAKQEWPNDPRQGALNYLEALTKSFSAWANGDVYGYVVEDADGEEIDSCWGYVGDMDYVISEAKGVVDYHVEYEDPHEAKVKEWRRQVAAGLTLAGFEEWSKFSHDMSVKVHHPDCQCIRCQPLGRPCDCNHCRSYHEEHRFS